MGWSKKNGVWQLHREPTCLCAFDADPVNYVKNGAGALYYGHYYDSCSIFNHACGCIGSENDWSRQRYDQ